MQKNISLQNQLLPVDIVLAPAWWYHNEGITFDEDFFYNPARRVEVERQMEKALYQRWGKFGLGEDRDKDLPVVGAVHLAAGYLLSEMLGCQVDYKEDNPPLVHCAHQSDLKISKERAFNSSAYKRFEKLTCELEKKFGHVKGDVGFAGVLNTGLDIRGENLFLDMFDKPEDVNQFFTEIANVTAKFTVDLQKKTGSTSISVNRNVRHLKPAVFVHSECSHTMISVEDYEKHLAKFDRQWSEKYVPYGIHYCGADPHRYAQAFAKLPRLDFLDVGWGGDVAAIRKALPNTFLNIRLSPVEIIEQSVEQIRRIIYKLVRASFNPNLTGVCCINMDEKVTDDKITAMFEAVVELRKEYQK